MAKYDLQLDKESLEKIGAVMRTTGINTENASKALKCLSQSLTNPTTENPKQNWLRKFLNRIVDLFRKI